MIHDKIKVALCFRGQMRMWEQGSEWQNRLRQRHQHDAEFICFGNTSRLETIAYTDPDVDVSKVNFRHCRKLELEDVQKRMYRYNVQNFRIFTPAHIYYQAKKIIDYWTENTEFREFLKSIGRQDHFIQKLMCAEYPNDLFFVAKLFAQRDLYYASQITLGDFISQYISAGHSFQTMDYFVQQGKIEKPDIVISLRWDTAIDFHDLYQLLDEVKGSNRVLGSGLIVKKQIGRVDDLAFAMDYETASSFLGDIDNRIFELLTDWRVLTSLSSFDPVGMPHIFWSFLIRHETELVNTDLFKAAVIRPGIEKHCDMEGIQVAEIERYFKRWNRDMNKKLADADKVMRDGIIDINYAMEMLDQKLDDTFN